MKSCGAYKIELETKGDENGKIVIIENKKEIPFEIARVFYIFDSKKDVVRGKHANRESDFVIINICGTSKIKVTNSEEEEIFILDKPHTGVYIPKMLWKDMYDFSENCILLVLSNKTYNPREYIRDFDEYLMEVGERSENINNNSSVF